MWSASYQISRLFILLEMLTDCLDKLLYVIDLSSGCVAIGVRGSMLNQFIKRMLKQQTWCKTLYAIDIGPMRFKKFCSERCLAGRGWTIDENTLW